MGEFTGGFRLLSAGLIVLTEDEALGFRPEGRRRKEVRPPQDLTSLDDLKEGDFVVHVDHGIGVYRGLVKLTVGAGGQRLPGAGISRAATASTSRWTA